VQTFQLLVQFVSKIIDLDVVVSGPVRKTADGESITLAAAAGLPSSVLAERYDLPPFITKQLSTSQKPDLPVVPQKEWARRCAGARPCARRVQTFGARSASRRYRAPCSRR
jgi:hypothetical protein